MHGAGCACSRAMMRWRAWCMYGRGLVGAARRGCRGVMVPRIAAASIGCLDLECGPGGMACRPGHACERNLRVSTAGCAGSHEGHALQRIGRWQRPVCAAVQVNWPLAARRRRRTTAKTAVDRGPRPELPTHPVVHVTLSESHPLPSVARIDKPEEIHRSLTAFRRRRASPSLTRPGQNW